MSNIYTILAVVIDPFHNILEPSIVLGQIKS